MAVTVQCPTMGDILAGNQCLENFAGLGSTVYVGLKEDLTEPMKLTDGVYSTPKFKSGKGLYRFDCKDDAQQIQGSSLKNNKGFELTGHFVIDAVSQLTAKYSRSVNNLKLFFIFLDGEEDSQILYDPTRNVRFDDGGIKSDTGKEAKDERTTTFECKLGPVRYDHLYVTPPTTGGWDSLLANKATVMPGG